MNKVKWIFSLAAVLFIVGILSTAAFASDPYNLNTVQNGLGLDVSFTGNTADSVDYNSTTKTYNAVSFDVVLKDGSNTIATQSASIDTATGKASVNFTAGLMEVGKVYTVYLYHTGNSTLLSSSYAVVIDGHNDTMLNQKNPTKTTEDGSTITLDIDGNGLVNANETGSNNTGKQRTGQKVHGFYQNNTNSCASCHQTHTANDNNLLFKDGVYSTCSACHDGTTGAFNSFSPTSVTTSDSISGTFNITDDTVHGSIHQADGSLKITSAPGGSNDSSSPLWNQDFDCASCHAPHGSGSADENNLNIDPLGWGGFQYKSAADGGTKDQQNGKLFLNIAIHDSVPTTMGDPYILVRTTASGVTSTKTDIGYLYYRAGVNNGDPIIQTYRWDGTKYIPDYSLWLRDYGYKKAPFKKANTVLYDSTGKDISVTTSDMTVVWRDGFAFGAGVSKVDHADMSIGIDVETTGNIQSLYDPTYSGYIPDSGVEMTKYCSACHTEYMTSTETGKNGVLTAYHRHNEVTDQLTCVRCHFAHGTKASIMKDSSDNIAAANTETLSDTNHSSALRRYENMDSCYTSGCHTKTNNGDPMYLQWSY